MHHKQNKIVITMFSCDETDKNILLSPLMSLKGKTACWDNF